MGRIFVTVHNPGTIINNARGVNAQVFAAVQTSVEAKAHGVCYINENLEGSKMQRKGSKQIKKQT